MRGGISTGPTPAEGNAPVSTRPAATAPGAPVAFGVQHLRAPEAQPIPAAALLQAGTSNKSTAHSVSPWCPSVPCPPVRVAPNTPEVQCPLMRGNQQAKSYNLISSTLSISRRRVLSTRRELRAVYIYIQPLFRACKQADTLLRPASEIR